MLRQWYSTPTPKTWRGCTHHRLDTETGLGQGFPEAAPLFCVGPGTVFTNLRSSHPSLFPVANQDDIYLAGPTAELAAGVDDANALLAPLGLQQNLSKLKFCSPDSTQINRLPPRYQSKFAPSL